jgi:nucleoside-diphosphate-sugar epimerase
MNTKVVVTGSSGYIGSALVDRLLTDPTRRVVGVDRAPSARAPSANFAFVQCDLSVPGSALQAPAFDGTGCVVHLAAARGDWAISEDAYWRDNLQATCGLLQAPWAGAVPDWVFTSSVSVYGPADQPLTEDAALAPIGPYGQSKLASEQGIRQFLSERGLAGRVIRPSAVFGPGHPANTNVYKLIEALRRWPLPLIGGGRNRKTLTYLPNLLDLIEWCMHGMAAGQRDCRIYNFVEEPVLTVAELIAHLRTAGIRPARSFALPLGLVVAAAYPVWGLATLIGTDLRVTPERVRKYASSTWYDASLLRREGFVPKVSLAEALNRTAQWHLSQ